MQVVIVEGEGAVLGVNLGRSILTKGAVLHSCVKGVIELLFGWWVQSAQALVY